MELDGNLMGCPAEYLVTIGWMSGWKLGSMVSKWVINCLHMGYIGVITHLLNLLLTSWDIQVVKCSKCVNGLFHPSFSRWI